MPVYSYTLDKSQLIDCNAQYRKRTLKISLASAIVFLVLFAAFFGLSFVEGFGGLFAISLIFGFVGLFVILIIAFSKKGVKNQVEMYFKSCQVDNVVDYEIQLGETEFIVSMPRKGNVNHYLYESIVRVYDLDGYCAVLLVGNSYLPIAANEATAPLIATLRSLAKSK